MRSVGWISEAHPPKSNRHSARSEAELQNLMSKQKNKISRDLEDSATARRMTVFLQNESGLARFCDCAQNDSGFLIMTGYWCVKN